MQKWYRLYSKIKINRSHRNSERTTLEAHKENTMESYGECEGNQNGNRKWGDLGTHSNKIGGKEVPIPLVVTRSCKTSFNLGSTLCEKDDKN